METRLHKERLRITKCYKGLRNGSHIKLYNATTHIILFQNEITRLAPTAAAAIQNDQVAAIQLHSKGIINLCSYS